MIEKHIVLEDIDPVIFYGVNNVNMKMIQALYPKLKIVARAAETEQERSTGTVRRLSRS